MKTRDERNSCVTSGIKTFARQKLAIVFLCVFMVCISLTVYSAGNIPYSFRPGEKISADQVNANFAALQNRLVELEQSIAREDPVGAIVAFAGTSERIPTGWFICDGREVSRFKDNGIEFTSLFLVIGVTWGVGDGVRTHNLPDLRGIFLRGANMVIHGSGARTDSYRDEDFNDREWANEMQRNDEGVGSYEMDELGAHRHEYYLPVVIKLYTDSSGVSKNAGSVSTTLTNRSGGKETRPRNAAINYIIKH